MGSANYRPFPKNTCRKLFTGWRNRLETRLCVCLNNSMKRSPANAILLAVATWTLLTAIRSNADTITLSVATAGPYTTTNSKSFTVPSNVVAQVISAYCFSPGPSVYSWIEISVAGTPSTNSARFSGSPSGGVTNLPTTIVGPATITLFATGLSPTPQTLSFCTIQTTSSYSFLPSGSVVIPNDGGGPVTIILESSTDLINWTSANPGTYGTTSSNRFFRVRAQR